MTVWFTADLHLGHRFVTELRGFASIDEHDTALCDAWRKVVRPADQVWVLGDIAVSNPTYALELIDGLPGTKHLIAGNHDACHPMHRDAYKRQRDYLSVFDSVQAFARRRVNGAEVLLSHFPYTTDRGFEARYPQYRLPDLGLPLLHGHTHLAERRTSEREFHVGVDAWGLAPVSLDQLALAFADARGASVSAGPSTVSGPGTPSGRPS